MAHSTPISELIRQLLGQSGKDPLDAESATAAQQDLLQSANAVQPYSSPVPGTGLLADEAAQGRERRTGRPKLWDLEDKYHCPVIGTCIPMTDLKRLAKKHFDDHYSLEDFDLHVEMVGCCRSRNTVSQAIQKYLEQKYTQWVKTFASSKTAHEVTEQWRQCLQRGIVAGPLWAALTHSASNSSTRNSVYGDIHMLSHQVGAGQAADARRLEFLGQENQQLKLLLEREKKLRQDEQLAQQKHHQQLEIQLRELQEKTLALDAMTRRVEMFESGQIMIDMGRQLMELQLANEQMRNAARRTGELDTAIQQLKTENNRLRQQQELLAKERDALERLILSDRENSMEIDGESDACQADCHNCTLGSSASSPRCVLYVGGRSSLVAQYRKLAERLGIHLLHHDGGQEENLTRLPEMIHGADAVMCPTDCVSHTAYYSLKNQCKKAGKPCLFFRGAGVSGFALAVARLNRGEFSLGNAGS